MDGQLLSTVCIFSKDLEYTLLVDIKGDLDPLLSSCCWLYALNPDGTEAVHFVGTAILRILIYLPILLFASSLSLQLCLLFLIDTLLFFLHRGSYRLFLLLLFHEIGWVLVHVSLHDLNEHHCLIISMRDVLSRVAHWIWGIFGDHHVHEILVSHIIECLDSKR